MICKSHGMGWDAECFLEIPWDGMGSACKSHGPFFSSHPIPLGALILSISSIEQCIRIDIDNTVLNDEHV